MMKKSTTNTMKKTKKQCKNKTTKTMKKIMEVKIIISILVKKKPTLGMKEVMKMGMKNTTTMEMKKVLLEKMISETNLALMMNLETNLEKKSIYLLKKERI